MSKIQVNIPEYFVSRESFFRISISKLRKSCLTISFSFRYSTVSRTKFLKNSFKYGGRIVKPKKRNNFGFRKNSPPLRLGVITSLPLIRKSEFGLRNESASKPNAHELITSVVYLQKYKKIFKTNFKHKTYIKLVCSPCHEILYMHCLMFECALIDDFFHFL